MSDWRLRGQEEYLSNITLYRVVFPDLWENSYRDKNVFFKKIEQDAKQYVKDSNKGHEFLKGEKIQHFWHEHCEFCCDKALTDSPSIFYCTKDLKYWICEECFNDFRARFNWQEKTSDELF